MKNYPVNNLFVKYMPWICVVLCISLYSILRLSVLKYGYEVGVDVFYHIRMGDFFNDVYSTKIFPWTQLSLWKNNFYDKELGFHAIISLLRHLELLFNIPQFPPFNFINIFFVSVILIIYTAVSYVNNLLTSLLTPLLLLVISPLFLLRINMIRPHLLSMIIFALIIWLLISNVSNKKKYFYIFVLGWLYAISYSSPQLIILPIISLIIAKLCINRKYSDIASLFLILFLGIVGILIGLLVHPQFPNTFYSWYVQGVVVLQRMIGQISLDLDIGLELNSPDINTLLYNISIYVFVVINILIFLKSKTKNIAGLTLLILSIITSIGFYFTERFIEYAVPSSVLCFTYLLNLLIKEINIKCQTKHLCKFLILFVVILPIIYFNFNILKNKQFYACYDFSKWASRNVRPGTYIGNIRWGDFPRLFFAAPQYRYSMALDPMFSYVVYPKKTLVLERFKLGKQAINPSELAKILNTKFVFISKFDRLPAKHLINSGAAVLYEGYDGWVLELNSNK
ncbi:MAG: hypothetical protein GY756_19355 [bacterium]|nr:hypothetical protein [bacterium]